jgi:hypothetical protein
MELLETLQYAHEEVTRAAFREETCRMALREDLVSRAEIAWAEKRSFIKMHGLWHKYPQAATWYIEVYLLIWALIGLLRFSIPFVRIREHIVCRILQYTEKSPIWT